MLMSSELPEAVVDGQDDRTRRPRQLIYPLYNNYTDSRRRALLHGDIGLVRLTSTIHVLGDTSQLHEPNSQQRNHG